MKDCDFFLKSCDFLKDQTSLNGCNLFEVVTFLKDHVKKNCDIFKKLCLFQMVVNFSKGRVFKWL